MDILMTSLKKYKLMFFPHFFNTAFGDESGLFKRQKTQKNRKSNLFQIKNLSHHGKLIQWLSIPRDKKKNAQVPTYCTT